MMTEQEKQALSQAVADKYGIEAYKYKLDSYMNTPTDEDSIIPLAYETVWLHDDWE